VPGSASIALSRPQRADPHGAGAHPRRGGRPARTLIAHCGHSPHSIFEVAPVSSQTTDAAAAAASERLALDHPHIPTAAPSPTSTATPPSRRRRHKPLPPSPARNGYTTPTDRHVPDTYKSQAWLAIGRALYLWKNSHQPPRSEMMTPRRLPEEDLAPIRQGRLCMAP
jgi:hypothetical protein